jgi:tetratricopeptide (TPR) repeat protein
METLRRSPAASFIALVWLAAAAATAAMPDDRQTPTAGSPDTPLLVSLSDPASELQEHPVALPLLLQVAISNPRAANTRSRNDSVQRARERLEKGGELEKMTAAEREAFDRMSGAAPVPAAIVGSQTDPVWSLITFEFVHESGEKFAPTVRPLATTTDLPRTVTLDRSGGPFMAFGIDPSALNTARPGKYDVRATLNTTGRRGMWLGQATSETIAVRLVAAASDPSSRAQDTRDYQEGRFYLLDKQFDRAESIAKRLLTRTPASVAAFELLGDAYDGLGRYGEAVQAFSAGIKAFEKRIAVAAPILEDVDADYPTYLLERVAAVRARQKPPR